MVQPIQPVRYPTITTNANVSTQLSARDLGAGNTYSWSPPTGLNMPTVKDPTFNYNQTTEYTITIATLEGCSVVDTLLVQIQEAPPPPSDIFVPNAWTPNNDGHNDRLYPLTINIVELVYFRIFNRWGQLMFETQVLGYGWDGIFNGIPQPSDVYTWTLDAIGIDGKHYKKTGTSVLLR